MLSAMAILPGIDVIAKKLGQQGMPVSQIVWARMFFGAALTLPFALRQGGVRSLVPERPVFHTVRAGLLMLATFCFFSSLRFLPIADALAIFFVQPLVLTALSPLLLGETVGRRRWAAVAVGFVGTLIIIRPGVTGLNPGSLLALGAGTSLALYFLMTRRIAGSAPALVTTFHTMLIGAVLSSVIAAVVWVRPDGEQWLLFAALGLIAALGHFLITRAYDFAEASLLAPLAYTEMVTSVALGWWFFGDFPDFWTFVGVAILIACAIYISVREQRAAPTSVDPASLTSPHPIVVPKRVWAPHVPQRWVTEKAPIELQILGHTLLSRDGIGSSFSLDSAGRTQHERLSSDWTPPYIDCCLRIGDDEFAFSHPDPARILTLIDEAIRAGLAGDTQLNWFLVPDHDIFVWVDARPDGSAELSIVFGGQTAATVITTPHALLACANALPKMKDGHR